MIFISPPITQHDRPQVQRYCEGVDLRAARNVPNEAHFFCEKMENVRGGVYRNGGFLGLPVMGWRA